MGDRSDIQMAVGRTSICWAGEHLLPGGVLREASSGGLGLLASG